jgi:predicted flap endonuclease-1-like 5' DNA nuclease
MSREFWIGLVAGLIVGWLIEWFIDWRCWRKRYQKIADQLKDKKDDFKEIKGVGKIIEKRLNDAGIFTYKRLSELTQPEIEKIIGKAQNLSDEKAFIKQAKKMAKKKGK